MTIICSLLASAAEMVKLQECVWRGDKVGYKVEICRENLDSNGSSSFYLSAWPFCQRNNLLTFPAVTVPYFPWNVTQRKRKQFIMQCKNMKISSASGRMKDEKQSKVHHAWNKIYPQKFKLTMTRPGLHFYLYSFLLDTICTWRTLTLSIDDE